MSVDVFVTDVAHIKQVHHIVCAPLGPHLPVMDMLTPPLTSGGLAGLTAMPGPCVEKPHRLLRHTLLLASCSLHWRPLQRRTSPHL